MLKMQTLHWQFYNGKKKHAKSQELYKFKRRTTSGIVQVVSYLLSPVLQRPVPELRLCAGTLRITRSQRPALGHLAIGGGGDTQEEEEV